MCLPLCMLRTIDARRRTYCEPRKGDRDWDPYPLLSDKPAKRRARRSSTHPAFGIWAKRADLTDSIAFANELRRRVEMRTMVCAWQP